MITIRRARLEDASAIEDIYAHYVRTSTCTFQREPDPPGAREEWLRSHDDRHPVIVAEDASGSGAVVGWACLSHFRDRWGYRMTVEDSVYIHHAHHRRGIGARLLEDVIQRARALGHHTILAGVSGDQPASVALHTRFGFSEVARMKEVGHKFDRWLDVVFLQKMLV